MKKIVIIVSLLILTIVLSGCKKTEITCGLGTEIIDGYCVRASLDEPVDDLIPEDEVVSDDTKIPDDTIDPIDTVVTNACETDLSIYEDELVEYSLVWSDEFDYEGKLDDSKWEYLIGNGRSYGIPGWGNNELQYYTDSLNNVKVGNGKLTITASTESYNQFDYTSGRVRTMNNADFKYGVFEVCAKMPVGLGTWPAIWMLPTNSPYGGWPYGGEIDIMEAVGFEHDIVHWNIHTKAHNWGDGISYGDKTYIRDINDSFHKYAVKWKEDSIQFYVDGILGMTYSPSNMSDPNYWPFDSEFHLILNIAIGGAWGGQRGIQEGTWETSMEVDYVRVFQERN